MLSNDLFPDGQLRAGRLRSALTGANIHTAFGHRNGTAGDTPYRSERASGRDNLALVGPCF